MPLLAPIPRTKVELHIAQQTNYCMLTFNPQVLATMMECPLFASFIERNACQLLQRYKSKVHIAILHMHIPWNVLIDNFYECFMQESTSASDAREFLPCHESLCKVYIALYTMARLESKAMFYETTNLSNHNNVKCIDCK